RSCSRRRRSRRQTSKGWEPPFYDRSPGSFGTVPRFASASEFLSGLWEPEVPIGVGHPLHQFERVVRTDIAVGDRDAHDVDGLARGDALELGVAKGFPVI